ncbi:protein Sla2p [[Candida] jaroonii]|uniref:Protein Sla2p n=1 Tax=[Candida] jaroonii TaxID=467808 RepID=A0ACA9Y4W4_9ASCO|nr:protein Sla2p [[Candida] jaroonii]
MSRAEVDLQISVKKACSTEEVPPKRKHVRACIVYTWDHKNSRAFWNAVKIQPLQSDQIQLFKSLVMIHKVLQEGHPNTLKDGYRNRDFIASLASVFPSHGNAYGRLINQYDKFILRKLDFHRNNPSFNGMFEYEEYISLRAVNDPNEGYDAILQLMDLQDSIEELQKLVFSTINQTPNNLCKVSALIPLVSEAYGIYKFCTSMLRAMYQQLGDDDALQALFDRFDSQHFVLRDFFVDCNSIKFLTTLVTIPRLPSSPPSLKVDANGDVSRPITQESTPQISSQPTGVESIPPPEPTESMMLQQTGMFDQQQLEQQRYQQQLEAERQQQLQAQMYQQQAFEQQQRDQQQRFLQEQQAIQAQQTQQQSRVSELENDLLMFKNQYDNDQQLLQQYDARVKSLETELNQLNDNATQQVASKDEQLRVCEEQINNWSKKYESLAKLYSKLRQEHLDLLARFKKIQQKISSAQESIQKREKFEKELKSKNIELADLIRERDRARLDLDRLRGTKDQEIEKLKAEVRELTAQSNESGKLQSMNLSSIMATHQKEMDDLKAQLAERGPGNLQELLKEKEIDLEIAQESLDSALQELAISKNDQEDIVNAEIDQILLKNVEKFRSLVDLILNNNIKRIQSTKHELVSPIQAGNLNASPEYLLSIIEQSSDLSSDFASVFNGFIVDGKSSYEDDSSYSAIILTSSDLTTSINDLMLNAKGLLRAIPQDAEQQVLDFVSDILDDTESYYTDILSSNLDKLKDEDDKIDKVIDCNLQLQHTFQQFITFVETLTSNKSINWSSKNLDKLVDDEMKQTAEAVQSASRFLEGLLADANIKGGDIEVHEAILQAAKAVIEAVSTLIKASTESQREIVSKSRGNQTRTDFYKKNNRWTEGLISASKAVAGATNILIQTADGVLRDTNSHEQLIVASNEVAASTAQLVAASRVKVNFVSKTQDNLETASTIVSSACKALVSKVQKLMDKSDYYNNDVDLSKLTPYEGKTVEMEQQVEILKLENMLSAARKRLGEIRKHGYRDDVSDDEK